MDKEKIEAAIQSMQTAIDDPSTPVAVKETLGQALVTAKANLAEYERDPHGQKRLVDDCHGLIVDIREIVTVLRDVCLSGMPAPLIRQTAEHGILLNSTQTPPAPEQRFEDEFVVYGYKTRFFNDYPLSVSLFNQLMQAPGADRYRSLLMSVARDMDEVLDIALEAREGKITEEAFRKATTCALRAVYFLNPLVMHLTAPTEDINAFFPLFLVDALTDIGHGLAGASGKKPASMAKGGKTGAPGRSAEGNKTIEITIQEKTFDINSMASYHAAQLTIIRELQRDYIGQKDRTEMEAFVRKELEKRITFQGEPDEAQKERVLTLLALDTMSKALGGQGLYKKGGKVTFEQKVDSIAQSLEGKPVPQKYQKTEGKRFTRKTARQAAQRIAGSMVSSEKKGGGPMVKKMLLGGVMIHAPGNMSLMDTDNVGIHSVGGEGVV